MMTVYLITNRVNGKMYVGQTIHSLPQRWGRHCWRSTTSTSSMPISHAIKKYGRDNFSIESLRQCSSQIELDFYELYYAHKLSTFSPLGYNLKAGSGPGIMAESVKVKIGQSNRGKKASRLSRLLLSISHKGLKQSEQAKTKLRELYRGKPVSLLGPAKASEVLSKNWLVTNPNGESMQVHNLTAFCKSTGLWPSGMSRVANGYVPQHKGWKVSRIW